MELALVVTIIAILALLVIPRFLNLSDEALKNQEVGTIAAIRDGISLYRMESEMENRIPIYPPQLDTANNEPSAPDNILFSEVLQTGIRDGSWIKDAENRYTSPLEHTFVYDPASGTFLESSALTPLGSTVPEISTGMIGLIQTFFDTNGNYPRSWGDYRFTDIGLNPETWDDIGYGGVVYTPVGSRIALEPQDGYRFTVMGLDGMERTLTPSLNWNIWYDMLSGQWYYHTVDPSETIDIDTLTIEQD